MARVEGNWHKIETVEAIRFICGHCSTTVSSEKGWQSKRGNGAVDANVRVCPECNKPSIPRRNSGARTSVRESRQKFA